MAIAHAGVVVRVGGEALRGAIRQEPRGGDARGHVGQLDLHGLVLADGLAEGGPLLGVAKRRLEGRLGDAHRGRGEREPGQDLRGSRRPVAEPRRSRRPARRRGSRRRRRARARRASRGPRPRSDRAHSARPGSRRARRRPCARAPRARRTARAGRRGPRRRASAQPGVGARADPGPERDRAPPLAAGHRGQRPLSRGAATRSAPRSAR